MRFSSFLKQTLTKACICFSLITAAYAGLSMIVNVDDQRVLLDAGRILLFFVASILFAIGNIIFSLKSINVGLRVLFHYIIYLLSVYICLILPSNAEASSSIVALTLFSVLYAISLTVILIVKSRYKVRNEKQQKYDAKFIKK